LCSRTKKIISKGKNLVVDTTSLIVLPFCWKCIKTTAAVASASTSAAAKGFHSDSLQFNPGTTQKLCYFHVNKSKKLCHNKEIDNLCEENLRKLSQTNIFLPHL
jgi:hypothetical protein